MHGLDRSAPKRILIPSIWINANIDPLGPTQRVYGPTPQPALRLITCGGKFDKQQRQYLDNIIVIASLAA